MMAHAEASLTAHPLERTRHSAAHCSASSLRLLPWVSHRDRRHGDAIPRRCSSRPGCREGGCSVVTPMERDTIGFGSHQCQRHGVIMTYPRIQRCRT
jgi:hypothetical protein